MSKYFLATILFLLGLVLIVPTAASAQVSFSDNTDVYLTGSEKTLTVLAGSSVYEMTVNPSSIVFDLVNGSNVTIRNTDRLTLQLSPAIAATVCKSGYSEITFSSYTTKSVTLTLGNVCGGGGAGGGGGAVVTAPVTATGLVTATAAGGKTTVTTGEGTKASVELPANAVGKSTDVKIVPVAKATVTVTAPVPVGKGIPGGFVFNYTASAAGKAVTTFAKTVTLTFTYTDAQIANLNEASLKAYYWNADAAEWTVLPSTVNAAANKVTATTDHLTYFALLGDLVEAEEEVEEEVTLETLRAKIAVLLEQITLLKARLAELTGEVVYEGVPAGFTFSKDLKQGMSGDEVKYLQIILNSDPATKVAESGAGSSGSETINFGPLTKAAVIEFQEKNASTILTPLGLTSGTGYVGSSTRAELNELLSGTE